MGPTARNVALIGLIALAVVVLPGGGNAANLLLAVISLAFLAAMAWFAARLYRENQFTLASLSTNHRALLYGAVAVVFATLVATDRLLNTGLGTVAWLALLTGSAAAVYYVWTESRRYA
jgi:TRAP-type C4-dicarboxylate transport system permease small subunit